MEYVNELELKSLVIRKNNGLEGKNLQNDKSNKRIDRYVQWYKSIKPKGKGLRTRKKIYDTVISLSEKTKINHDSYENFGQIIITMTLRIIEQKKYSGYTYTDDFVSDSYYKVLAYLHNFDHTKKSKTTGQFVSPFSYISQIINNAIVFVINKKKNENDNISNEIGDELIEKGIYNIDNFPYTTKKFNVSNLKEIKEIVNTEKNFMKDNYIVIYYSIDDIDDFDDLNEMNDIQLENKHLRIIANGH